MSLHYVSGTNAEIAGEFHVQVREAVDTAKDYVLNLFGADGLTSLRLEEVERDPNGFWNVTVGFVRPMALTNAAGGLMGALSGEPLGPRVYRVVRIDDRDGEVMSVKIREGLG